MDEWELELQLKSVCNDFVSCHSHRHWVVTKRREDLCVLAWKQELDGLYDNWLSLYCKKEKNTINGNWWQVETKMINLQKICDLWPEQSDQNIMDWMDQWSVMITILEIVTFMFLYHNQNVALLLNLTTLLQEIFCDNITLLWWFHHFFVWFLLLSVICLLSWHGDPF